MLANTHIVTHQGMNPEALPLPSVLADFDSDVSRSTTPGSESSDQDKEFEPEGELKLKLKYAALNDACR
jgi:hypothetical protein